MTARKILVTGSTGFLGSALVERLLTRGERDLRAFVRPSSDRRRLDALARRFPEARLEYFEGSLSAKESAAKALDGVDLVYHLAAGLSGSAADIQRNTVAASKNLLDGVVASGRPIKVVLVSSFGVYGAAELPKDAVIDEETPLEPHPEKRDAYSRAKLAQELLFRDVAAKHGFPLVVLRPGVIYGPRGENLSARVGLGGKGLFFHLGGDNLLPLTYVDNCAEALAIAGQRAEADGQVLNVVDDDLPTCAAYLARYRAATRPVRTVRLPYAATAAIASAFERLHALSKGRVPAILTPYRAATTWKGNRFDNRKLKALGWTPIVPAEEAMRRTLAHLGAYGG